MVYFPKPDLLYRIVGEISGCFLFMFASRVVVATTGGSLSFATNLLPSAMGDAAGYFIALSLYPYAMLDFTVLVAMVFHDVLMWIIGERRFSIIDMFLYPFLALVQFVVYLLVYVTMFAFVPSDVSHLGIPRVAPGVTDERAVFAAGVQSAVFVAAYFIVSEMVTPIFRESVRKPVEHRSLDRKEMQQEGKSAIKWRRHYRSAEMTSTMSGAPTAIGSAFVIPGMRVDSTAFMLASVPRAFFIACVRFFVSLGGISITGGLYNTFGYLGGAIVSWTWDSTWYVQTFAPLIGLVGFLGYIVIFYVPAIDVYSIMFGEDRKTIYEFSQRTELATQLPKTHIPQTQLK
jgi:hypothetical protein